MESNSKKRKPSPGANGKKKPKKDNRLSFFKDLNSLSLYTNDDRYYREAKIEEGPLELDW